MGKNTSVEIGDDLGRFVDHQVKSGRYGSASEVVRAGLRFLQEKETKLEVLRVAVQEGLDSGDATPFDFDGFIASRRERRK